MKELTIEQKAQRYDEAIDKFDVILNLDIVKESGTIFADDVRKILPELIENEDEEIRKHIIQVFRDHFNGEDCDKCIAWLEKQGEQKPADKVEPRFKPGDWITDGNITIQIEAIKNNCYLYCGDCALYSTKTADKVYHLWTIQDAKDGDVLVVDNIIFIYKRTLANHIVSYCKLINDIFEPFGDARTCCESNTYVHPATKEQCDVLFQKMKEAGYEWDAKKKELKEIEQKPTNNQFTPEQADVLDKHIDEYLEQKQDTSTQIDPSEYINDMGGNGCYLKNTVQSPTWSDEDFYMLGQAIKCVNNSGKLDVSTEKIEDWLKSFKDKIQPQPKQEWGEEDEESILEICNYLDRIVREDEDNQATLLNVQELKNWLKSLRPQINITDEELAQAKKDAYNDVLDKIEYDSENPTFDDGWSAAIWYLKKKNAQPQNRWKESLATANLENSLCDIQDGFSDTSYEYRILGEAIEFIRCTESKSQWKPSDKQVKALRWVLQNIPYNTHKEEINELLLQLQQL